MVRLLLAGQGIFALSLLVLLNTTIWHETPKFYIIQGDRENAIKTIEKYTVDADAEEICDLIESQTSFKSTRMSLGQAFCSKKYRRSSWIAVGIVFFIFMNGYYAINVFAN